MGLFSDTISYLEFHAEKVAQADPRIVELAATLQKAAFINEPEKWPENDGRPVAPVYFAQALSLAHNNMLVSDLRNHLSMLVTARH